MNIYNFPIFYDILIRMIFLFREKKVRRLAISEFVVTPPRRLLEVGVGTGKALIHAPFCTLVGCDLSVDMLKKAQLRFMRAGRMACLVAASGEDIPFPAKSFDGVLLFLFCSQVGNFPRIINEINRVLESGGRLLTVDYFPGKFGHKVWLETCLDFVVRPFGLTMRHNAVDSLSQINLSPVEIKPLRSTFPRLCVALFRK